MYRFQLIISSTIIVIIQIISVIITANFALKELRHNAIATTDQISSILAEPLYNIDDSQAAHIGAVLFATGNVTRISIYSTASGQVFLREKGAPSAWLPHQTRAIRYLGIELGRVDIDFTDGLLYETIRSFLLVMVLVIAGVFAANFAANRIFIHKRAQRLLGVLNDGIAEFGAGNYGKRIEPSGYDDIDGIGRIVNEMAIRIEANNRELVNANATLETRVRLRTSELETALAEQKFLQDQLIENGKLSALGQLSASVAHEITGPLESISAIARSLGELDGKEEIGNAREMLLSMNESAKRAISVIDALKAYLEPSKGNAKTVVEIDRDLERTLALLHGTLADGIEIKTDLQPATVLGASDQLFQIWITLVRNAAISVSFSGTISIRTGEWNHCTFVEVEDNGPGIPENDRIKVFEPSFGAENGKKDWGKGLDISKKIAESCGGTITFDSRPGKTVFTVTFPSARKNPQFSTEG